MTYQIYNFEKLRGPYLGEMALACFDIDGDKDKVGYSDGLIDGTADGPSDGRCDGFKVGYDDGISDGVALGCFDIDGDKVKIKLDVLMVQ